VVRCAYINPWLTTLNAGMRKPVTLILVSNGIQLYDIRNEVQIRKHQPQKGLDAPSRMIDSSDGTQQYLSPVQVPK